MQLRILGANDVRAALPMRRAIESAREAFAELSAGTAEMPQRTVLETNRGVTLFMPAYLKQAEALAQKIVSVYPENPVLDLPMISGLVAVLDSNTGQPRALLDGGTLTAIRTAAASGLATELLSRADARCLLLFGAGRQAYDQVMAAKAVRSIDEVAILSKHGNSCTQLADRLRSQGIQARSVRDPVQAVREADVIVCATPSTAPLFRDEDVVPGTHINAVGAFTREMQEVPPETVLRARVVVDQLEAALVEAGDLLKPRDNGKIDQSHFEATLGDVMSGSASGRSSDDEITLFKSVGLAVQDAAAAQAAAEKAEEDDVGMLIEL